MRMTPFERSYWVEEPTLLAGLYPGEATGAETPGLPQKRFPSPACFRTAFAVWRDFIVPSTGKCFSVMSEYQIS